MTLQSGLTDQVTKFFNDPWKVRTGWTVPDTLKLTYKNTAIRIDAVVLYADLSNSTNLVDTLSAEEAASIYKSYLLCAGKIITAENGDITAYDGDRIMAVFLGDGKEKKAVKAAKKISYAVENIINPIRNSKCNFLDALGIGTNTISHTVGIDKSELFVVKSGFRGADDLVWVGKAANHAAKMGDIPSLGTIRMSEEVYNAAVIQAGFLDSLSWGVYPWNEMGRRVFHSSMTEPISPTQQSRGLLRSSDWNF